MSAKAVSRYPGRILLLSALLVLTALWGAVHVKPEYRQETFMKRGSPTYFADKKLLEYFGAYDLSFFMVEGNVEDPRVLEKLAAFEKKLNDYPLIEKVLGKANWNSVNSLINKKGLRIGPNGSVREVLDKIMASEETANYPLNRSYRQAAERMVHKSGEKYDAFLGTFWIKREEGDTIRALKRSLEEDIKSLGFYDIPNLQVRIGGGVLSWHHDEGFYFKDLLRSFLWSFLFNFLIVLLIWRRFWFSLLAMIPIAFSILLTIGVMGILDISLNVLNLTLGAIAVGLGIDYAIHLIERTEEEERRGLSGGRRMALQVALTKMSPTLFAASLTTIVGFSAATVLAMPVAETFGLLMALTLLFIFLSSIFLLPVLLLKLGKRRLE